MMFAHVAQFIVIGYAIYQYCGLAARSRRRQFAGPPGHIELADAVSFQVRPWLRLYAGFVLLAGAALAAAGGFPHYAGIYVSQLVTLLLLFVLMPAALPDLLRLGGPHLVIAAVGLGRPVRPGGPLPGARRRRLLQVASRLRPAAAGFLAVLPAVALTVVLFPLFGVRTTEALSEVVQPAGHPTAAIVIFTIFVLMSAAVWEEVFFRYALQAFVAGAVLRLRNAERPATGLGEAFAPSDLFTARAVAVVVSALLFAISHGGMIEPAWIKYLQTFVVGIGLGIVQWRAGLEAAIFGHLIFNIAAPFLTAPFLQS